LRPVAANGIALAPSEIAAASIEWRSATTESALPPRASLPGSVRRFYHPELDVLRFAAFVAVFIGHAFAGESVQDLANYGLPRVIASALLDVVESGRFGVTLFFLLSSYLITALLLREHAASGRIDLRSFYIRRSLRIWPLYFFFLAICFWVLPAPQFPGIPYGDRIAFSLFVGNWAVIFHPHGWTPQFHYTVFLHLWSVSVEQQFYLFWPLALALFGFNRLRKVAFVLLATATLARLFLIPHYAGEKDDFRMWFNTLVQLDPIAVGALIAFAFRDGLPSIPSGIRTLLLILGVALPSIALSRFGVNGWGALLTYPLVTAGMALILVAVLTDTPKSWMSRGPLVYLGKISYGLYVYHLLMLWLAYRQWPDSPERIVFGGLLGTIAAAIVSYNLLERPFLQMKERFAHVRSRPA
jgi:peptidoglycan/LPS O-acetylase OafA/YrhL